MSPYLRRGSGQFYVDTGADGTLIKRKCVRENISVNNDNIIAINGVTLGRCLTLGQIHIELCGLLCQAHIVPDEFPIDTDGLLGWDILSKHEGQVNVGKRRLELNQLIVPFSRGGTVCDSAKH